MSQTEPSKNTVNHWTPAQLAQDAALSPHPVRYHARLVKLSPWWTLFLLLAKRRWIRHSFVFDPVFYGEPGYEEARWEATVLNASNTTTNRRGD